MRLVWLDGHCTGCCKSPLVKLWKAAVYRAHSVVCCIASIEMSIGWTVFCILLMGLVPAGPLPVPGPPIQHSQMLSAYKTGQSPRCHDPLQAFRNLLSPTQLAQPMVQAFQHATSPTARPQSVTAHHKVLTHLQRGDASKCVAQRGGGWGGSFFSNLESLESRHQLKTPLKMTQQIVV